MILVCTQNGELFDTIWRPCSSINYSYNIGDIQIDYYYTLTPTFIYSTSFTGDGKQAAGVGVALTRLADSPTGTLTVVLRNTTTSTNVGTASVSVSSLPQKMCSYVYFSFSSPATLTSGNNFSIGLSASVSGEIGVHNNTPSNFLRFVAYADDLVAPAALDQLFIIPHCSDGSIDTYAIEMGTYSNIELRDLHIGDGCRLDFRRDRDTRLIFSSGYGTPGTLRLYTNAICTIGTEANPIPSDYTAELAIHYAYALPFSHFEICGTQLVNHTRALLASTANADATSIVLDRSVDWRMGDQIVIAGTQQVGQTEVKTVASNVNGNIVPLTTALTYTHIGDVANNMQAEVLRLRPYNVNLIVRQGTNYCFTIYNAATLRYNKVNIATYDNNSSEHFGAIAYRYRNINYTTEITMRNCSSIGVPLLTCYSSSATTTELTNVVTIITIEDCDVYACNRTALFIKHTYISSSSIKNCWFIVCNFYTVDGMMNTYVGNRIADVNIRYDYRDRAACRIGPSRFRLTNIQMRNNVIHTVNGTGLFIYYVGSDIEIMATPDNMAVIGDSQYESLRLWHCNLDDHRSGCLMIGCERLSVNNLTILGSVEINLITRDCRAMYLNNLKLGSSPYVNTNYGWYICPTKEEMDNETYYAGSNDYGCTECVVNTAEFGKNSGASRPHTIADIKCGQRAFGICRIYNLYAGTAPLVDTYSAQSPMSVIVESWQSGGDAPVHAKRGGKEHRDTARKRTAPASVCLVPVSQTIPLEGYYKQLGVVAGRRYNVRLWCYVTSNFNGSATWYILPDPVLNVPLTALATITSSTPRNTWIELSGVTPVLSEDGVLQFAIRCTGTAGSINVADIEASPIA